MPGGFRSWDLRRSETAFLLACAQELVAGLLTFSDLLPTANSCFRTLSGSEGIIPPNLFLLIRSHPPPRAGCPRGDPGPLPVLALSAGAVAQAERHDLLQQRFVIDAAMFCR